MAILKVGKWGNSKGLRLPLELTDGLNVEVDDELVIVPKDEFTYEIRKKVDDSKLRVWYTKDDVKYNYMDVETVQEAIGAIKAWNNVTEQLDILYCGLDYFDENKNDWLTWHDKNGNEIYHYV